MRIPNRKSMSAGLLLLTVLTISACSSPKALKKPEYAPAIPVATEPRADVNGSIYHASSNMFLFEDLKARRIGDLITVILDEQTNAAKSASTNTKKDAGINVAAPTLFGRGVTYKGKSILQAEVESGSNFSGTGDSSQSNSLSGNITVTIAKVYANGNMLIRGEKLLTLNQGSEVIRISGLVRASDVTPENTVQSNQIANANITYTGRGAIADSNQSGWISRIFNSPLWPF